MPNLVKKQFPSGTLSSFQNTVTTAVTAGPAQTNAASLAVLAQDLNDTSAGAAANVSHSVPNPLGNITSFASTIQQINDQLQKLPDAGQKKAYLTGLEAVRAGKYNEWLGLCALVALRNVYSMNGLQVELSYEQFVDEPFDHAVYFSLKNMDYQYSWMAGNGTDITNGGMFYLKVNGQYIALYNLEVGLCPMQRYPTSAWADKIPWFDPSKSEDVHQCWMNPFEVLADNDYVLTRLANWLELNNGTAPVAAFYPAPAAAPTTGLTPDWASIQSHLNNAITGNVPDDKKKLVQNAAENFCTSYAAYLNRAGKACPMPNLLTESLFLADRPDNSSCGLGYPVKGVSWSESWKQLRLTSETGQLNTDLVVPTVPFTEAGCEALECGYGDGDYELSDISFRADGDVNQPLESILATFTLFFPQTKETFVFSHEYLPEKIRIGTIPYLGVWPNVKMPENSGWKYYIATQAPSHAKSLLDKEDEQKKDWNNAKPARIELTLHGGTERSICEKGAVPSDSNQADRVWKVTQSDRPFRFATLQYVYKKDGTAVKCPCGAVFVRPNETFAAPASTVEYELAVDFGTTSTVCAVRKPDGTVSCLPFIDYMQNVTIGSLENEILPVEESRMLGTAPGEIDSINQKTILHQKKVMSVAQLYANYTSALSPYVDGRFFLANSVILCRYIDGVDFAARGICNELKLAELTDQEVLDATAMYLSGIYLHALLYIMEKSGVVSKLNLSYPDKSYQLELNSRWRTASGIVNSCFDDASPYRLDLDATPPAFWTEANAANNYFTTADIPANIIVDIGGGTADISMPGTDKTASVQFAGRELMVNSLIESYRHWHGDSNSLRDDSFSKMWGAPLGTGTEAAKPTIIDAFNSRCAALNLNAPSLQNALSDQTLRMLTEVLLNDYEMNIKGDQNYSLLRSLITFKFGLLMSLVAQFILDNKDALVDSTKQVMGQNGWMHPLSIRFVGTAAKTLEHVFGDSLVDINGKNSNGNHVIAAMADLLHRLTDISFLLTVYVSKNVQEKNEVAFGMLSAPAAAAPAPAPAAIPIIPGLSNFDSPAPAAVPGVGISSGANDDIAFMKDRICEIMWGFMADLDFDGRRRFYKSIFNDWPPLDVSMDTEPEWKKVLQAAANSLAGVPTQLKTYYNSLNAAWQNQIVDHSIQELQQKAATDVPAELKQLLDSAMSFSLAVVHYGGKAAGLDLGAGVNAISIDAVMPNAIGAIADTKAKDLSRKNLLTNSLGLIKNNHKNMQSLANQKNPAMRMKLLNVYLAVSMLNDALSQRQIDG